MDKKIMKTKTGQLTKNNLKKYIKSCGCYCPFCNSDNVYTDPLNTDNMEYGIIKQEANCCECGKTWEDIYKLSDVNEIKP